MKRILFIFVLISISSLFWGEQIEITDLPVGRSLSLAGDTSLVNNSALNVLANPAMLAVTNGWTTLQYNKMYYYADTTYDILGFSFRERAIDKGNSFAVVVGRFASGKILVHDIEGEPTNEKAEYTVSIAAVGFSSVLSTDKTHSLWLGLAGYGVHEKINVDSYFVGGNIGALLQHKVGEFLKTVSFGITIRGIGVNSNWLCNQGLSFEFNKLRLIVSHENYLQKRTQDKVRAGLSVDFYKTATSNVTVDLGYSFGKYTEIFSCGIELRLNNFELNYSFSQHTYLKSVHNLSLIFRLF